MTFTYGKHNEVEFTINEIRFNFGQVLFGTDCSYSDIMHFELKDSTYIKIKYFVKDNDITVLKVMIKE